jgi:outer membrane protein OmpA-like peptidoglycan-associated protein
MHRILRFVLSGLIAAAILPLLSAQTDKPGSKDFPGISRMPTYFIDGYKNLPFDSFTFTVTEKNRNQSKPVEGHAVTIQYQQTKGAQPTSALQILRNYQNAAKSVGGEVLFQNSEDTTLRLPRAASEVWVDVHIASIGPTIYYLNIIEKQEMAQDVVIDAKAMGDGLNVNGHFAVPGIYFDFGKSDLKPDSNATIAEIAKLLKANPTLKLWVVGHTDAVGAADANVTLSNARAAAVVRALVQQNGIAAQRLASFGAGPYTPVATNDTDDGRALNRRVELVKHP